MEHPVDRFQKKAHNYGNPLFQAVGIFLKYGK